MRYCELNSLFALITDLSCGKKMSLLDLLMQNPNTVIAYSIFFAVLALTLPFIGYLGRIFPSLGKEGNFKLAKIFAIVALIGVILTVGVSFTFVYLKIRDIITFEFFAVITFVFPLILAPFAYLPFYLTKQTDSSVLNLFKVEGRTVRRRNATELFVVYAAFGVVGSNFHDILWCGEATDWFTHSAISGGELQIWVDIVGAVPAPGEVHISYDFFGFFMLLHVLFCGAIATFMLWRYTRRYGENFLRNPNSRSAFLLAWIGALLWGYGLYLMDSSSSQSSVAWMVGTFIWIPLGIFILALSARYLSRFELALPDSTPS